MFVARPRLPPLILMWLLLLGLMKQTTGSAPMASGRAIRLHTYGIQAVVFLFRFGKDGSMVVTMADAERVLDTASKTRLCKREPERLLEVFMENCGAGEDRIYSCIDFLFNPSGCEMVQPVSLAKNSCLLQGC